MAPSRRAFLGHVVGAGAAGLIARMPARSLWTVQPAEFLPEPDEAWFRQLALAAVDVARTAGASFADIRLTAARYLNVHCDYSRGGTPVMGAPSLGIPTRYGIRAIVDGAWGFAGGSELTVDAIVDTAHTAVAVARGNAPRRPRVLELAPVDIVPNGVWATPMEQDPFKVPVGEQGELGLTALHEATKVPEITSARTSFQWRRPITVMATTDGTLLVQRYATALPSGAVWVATGSAIQDNWYGEVEGVRPGPYGYEALGGTAIITGMRPAAERAIELVKASRNAASAEVGRYDIVFAPRAVATLLATTIAHALNAELALGYRANSEGTSFASPPRDLLGSYQAASPLITIRGDRTRRDGAATVGWDEEGVKPRPYTFVERGVVVDYHTNRETAPQIGDWYRKRGEPVHAQGLARRCGSDWPTVFLPNLTLESGAGNATADDLVRGIKRGLYIENVDGGADHQVLNAQYGTHHTGVRSIIGGKLGSHVKDVGLQFITTAFWKQVEALGGANSATSMPMITDGGALVDALQPLPYSTFQVVPLHVRQVNVLNIGRSA